MFGERKVRRFLIMDGSDIRFLEEIKGLAKMVIGHGRVKIRKLAKTHPTMKVVAVKSGYRQWTEIRKLLEELYPEQCVFDAPL